MNEKEENMYGDIEKKIYHDISLKTEIPDKISKNIREGIKKKEKKNYSFARVAMTICATLLISAGIVYAGTAVYEKIWKEPEKIVSSIDEKITEKDLESIMTEEEARERAEGILERVGYEEGKIKSIELEKWDVDEMVWHIETDNKISLSFDAKGGKNLRLSSKNIFDKDIDNYRTTKVEAEKTARELCKKYGYDLSEYSFVEISSNLVKGLTNEPDEDEAYIWYVDFYKEYDNLVNKYDNISIAFVPEINELFHFSVEEKKFEDNPVQITEEQAKEIALTEEQKTNIKYALKDTKVELGIVSMNGRAYERTTDYKQFCEKQREDYPDQKHTEYRTDSRIRKAWKVMIDYDIPVHDIFNEAFINGDREVFPNIYNEEFNHSDFGFTYYVDATTGEIIGGYDFNKQIGAIMEDGKIVGVEYKEQGLK